MTKKQKLPPHPKGLSLYVRAISKRRHGTPAQFAKKCSDHGLKWIALGGPWHETRKGVVLDRWINTPATIRSYAEALAKKGIRPHVWGYPWHERIEKFVEELEICSLPLIEGWLLDPELGLKKKPREAARLVHLARSSNPYRIIGFTSYGMVKGHPTFPWDEFAERGGFFHLKECDYGSPQLYDTPKSKVIEGMDQYSKLGFDVVIPSFGLYKFIKKDASLPLAGRNRRAVPLKPSELNAHLLSFVDAKQPVDSMIGWAENFATGPLWRTLAQWADRLDRGIASLGGGLK